MRECAKMHRCYAPSRALLKRSYKEQCRMRCSAKMHRWCCKYLIYLSIYIYFFIKMVGKKRQSTDFGQPISAGSEYGSNYSHQNAQIIMSCEKPVCERIYEMMSESWWLNQLTSIRFRIPRINTTLQVPPVMNPTPSEVITSTVPRLEEIRLSVRGS